MLKLMCCLLLITTFLSCKKEKTTTTDPIILPEQQLYFPPIGSNTWDTASMAALGWNTGELQPLYSYLQQKNTKGFIILYNGRIVAEKYFGTFTKDSLWYWASAGKTVTAMLAGIAQEQGYLNINNLTSQYLGRGWTSEPLAKENLITVKHQLTMTTGLDDGVPVNGCFDPACLQYKADAGTRWAYHNAPYTLMDKVIENATGKTFNQYFAQAIKDKTGMDGLWYYVASEYANLYYSTTRSMARFGILMQNKGRWQTTPVLADTSYFNAQVNTSQNLNLSYGYLTWLNGKTSYRLPTTQFNFPGFLVPNAPADMYAALGKNDQKLYVVPSKKVVVVRMGNSAEVQQQAVSNFDNELWSKLKTLMNY